MLQMCPKLLHPIIKIPLFAECLSSGTVSLLREMSSSLGDDIKRWRSASVEAYQTQLSCLERMRHEIMLLRTTVSSQVCVNLNLMLKVVYRSTWPALFSGISWVIVAH